MKKTIFFLLVTFILLGFVFVNQLKTAKPKTIYNQSSKVYFAPKSGIKIEINSKSYVDENSDLGNGNAFVKLYNTNQKIDTVFLKTSPENIDFITYKSRKIKFVCSQLEQNKLYDYLISIGFKNLNKNEIAELRDAMTLINYGPKATFLEGQTKFITVEK